MLEDGERQQNPLIEALPPKSDYITYLLILEYNLEKSQLGTLHHLLQDAQLTTNIGWDLVQLLLPLLPDSEQCLLDVANLGNPRETVLKVAELLEEMGQLDTDNKGPEDVDEDQDPEKCSGDNARETEPTRAHEASNRKVRELEALLRMLCLVHPRIATRKPSRFLATSVFAIPTAFKTVAWSQTALCAVLGFIRTLAAQLLNSLYHVNDETDLVLCASDSLPDPEACSESVAIEEAETILRLLRSLLTHVIASYFELLEPVEGSSPFAWTDRYIEKQEPHRISRMRRSFRDLFRTNDRLRERDAIARQILATADLTLSVPWRILLETAASLATDDSLSTSMMATPDFKASGEGILHLLALKVNAALLGALDAPFLISVSEDHCLIIETFADVTRTSEPQASSVLDSVLLLGWAALTWNGGFSHFYDDDKEAFFNYLNQLNMISACTPHAHLRHQYHIYSSIILHSNQSSQIRLNYVKDTLENCPFPNLKVSAIGWLKGEIASAFNLGPAISFNFTKFLACSQLQGQEDNVFATPNALSSTAPYLFATPSNPDDADLISNLPFWVASVNLLYLLHSSHCVYNGLKVADLGQDSDLFTKFVPRLESIVKHTLNMEVRIPSTTDEAKYLVNVYALEDSLKRLENAITMLP